MDKINYGIICALKEEAEGIISNIKDKKECDLFGITYNCGTINNKSIVVAVCGMGKVNAAICAQTMIISFNPDVIINVGLGGSLDKTLKRGEVVIADKLVQHDVDTSFIGDPVGYISGTGTIFFGTDKEIRDSIEKVIKELDYSYRIGTIASGDQFVCTKEAKDKIVSNFGAIVCEMEGAAIAHVCYTAGVKCAVLRYISDGADEDSNMDYYEFKKKAGEKTTHIIVNLIK